MSSVAEIRGVLEELLADPQIRAALSRFGPEHEDRMDRLESQVGGMLADKSLGLVQSGPLWLSGTSIIDGTVTATKLIVTTLESVTASTGTLNVTGTITAAAAFPATGERVTISSSGILGINSGATTTFKLGVDGSGWLGSGASQVSWTSGGVVTIPAAAIGTLTIADIDTGIFGGTYSSSANTTRFELSSSSLRALASGTETFKIDASTGAVTATGSFTIKSTATGAHVTIDNAGGIAGYNATSEVAGNRTFLLNAVTGAGHLGLSTGSNISWDGSGNVSIQGSLIVTGTIAADRITSGTITGGATVNIGTADLVVNSTGKLKFGTSSADYLSNDILHFEVASDTGKIEFKNGSNTPVGQLRGNASSSLGQVQLYAFHSSTHDALVSASAGPTSGTTSLQQIQGSYVTQISLAGSTTLASNSITFDVEDTILTLVNTNRAASFYGRLYLGTGSGVGTTYLLDGGSDIADLVADQLRISGDVTKAPLIFSAALTYSVIGTGGALTFDTTKFSGLIAVSVNGYAARIPYF